MGDELISRAVAIATMQEQADYYRNAATPNDSAKYAYEFKTSALDCVIRSVAAIPVASQCCMCGKTGLSTVEGDGGQECELSDGRWVCSGACYDRATAQPATDLISRSSTFTDAGSGLPSRNATVPIFTPPGISRSTTSTTGSGRTR